MLQRAHTRVTVVSLSVYQDLILILTYVTGSRIRDHFTDLLESRYRHLNNDKNTKIIFFADSSFTEVLYGFLSSQTCRLKTAMKKQFCHLELNDKGIGGAKNKGL